MNGLAKKFLLPLVLAGMAAMPKSAFGQQQAKPDSSFVPKTYWSGEIGIYGDDDSKINDRYSPIWGFDGRVARDFGKNFRGELAAALYTGKGDFQAQGSSGEGALTMTSLEGEVLYQDKSWSWGAGLILSNVRERISVLGGEDSQSGSGFGLVLGGGYDINLGDGSKLTLKLLYIPMLTGPDMSGVRISAGFKDVLK